MTNSQPASMPSLVSLLICDQVIDDKLTHKKSAIGIFNTILVPKMPTAIQHMAILAALTEISGRVNLELRLIRDADNEVLFSGKGAVEAPDPLAVVDLLFALRGVRIPEPGAYAFELLCGAAILGRRRFRVMVREGGKGGGTVGAPPDTNPEPDAGPEDPAL
jgi:hypothetical protein